MIQQQSALGTFEAISSVGSFEKCCELFSGLSIVFYRFQAGCGGCFYSSRVKQLLGYEAEELCASPMLWHDSIHPEDLPGVDQSIAKIVAGDETFDIEYRIRHREGHWLWVHDRCVRQVSQDGSVIIEGAATDITPQKNAETAIVLANQQLEQVLDSLDAAVFLYDRGTDSFRGCNYAATTLFGYGRTEVLTLSPPRLHPDPSSYETFVALIQSALTAGDHFSTECSLRRADGATFPAEVRIRRLRGDVSGQTFVMVVNDLTEKHAVEESLALARQVFDNASEAVMITDAENRILSVNNSFSRITGWSAAESIGRNPSFLSSGKQSPEFYRDMWQVLKDSGVWQGEVVNRRRSGQYFPEWLSISTVRNRQGVVTHYLAIFSDISERKRTEGLIHRYSWFDSLTDLPNKALLFDRINQAITSAQNEGRALYLMAINLNRLKQVNDSLGHRVGDEVLKVIAQRLLAGTREGDTVSRVTGDDFVVLVPRLGQPHRAMALAERLLDSINAPLEVEGNAIHVTANCGIAAFPSDGSEPEVLLRNADAALNHARTWGANKIAFFEPHMNTEILEKITLQSELADALGRGEFQLYFQPQACLSSAKLAGVEALIRWSHPVRGMISPGVFIPVAEELGLIIPIGEWVINEACRCLAEWQRNGHEDLLVAVNLSALQFAHPNLVNVVREAIHRHGIQPACLELEITEGVAMHAAAEVLTRLQELKQVGVKISIDDFGTGYSSLAYLRRFAVDKLKIDQSFVHDMLESSEATSIVRAVVALGHGLALNVIAEGVETPEQREALVELGCDEIQGYLLSRPISFEAMTHWLDNYDCTR